MKKVKRVATRPSRGLALGLAPAIRSKLMQDRATIAKAKANRPLYPGYTQSGFDSWSLLELPAQAESAD